LLLLDKSDTADIRMRIFNPDGTEVSMCGNGSRCIAYYAVIHDIAKGHFTIETQAGKLKASVENRAVKIGMTPPKDLRTSFDIKIKGKPLKVNFVDTGVPHVVNITDDVEMVDVNGLGKEIRQHKLFAPDGTNANFVQVKDRNTIFTRTYERGVEDETLACGTGAVASAIVSSVLGHVDSPVKVKTRGGDALYIYFDKKSDGYDNVFLEGEVEVSYEGSVNYV
jgi:diaminopimelate epimerase